VYILERPRVYTSYQEQEPTFHRCDVETAEHETQQKLTARLIFLDFAPHLKCTHLVCDAAAWKCFHSTRCGERRGLLYSTSSKAATCTLTERTSGLFRLWLYTPHMRLSSPTLSQRRSRCWCCKAAQPVAQHGLFVMNTRVEIQRALRTTSALSLAADSDLKTRWYFLSTRDIHFTWWGGKRTTQCGWC